MLFKILIVGQLAVNCYIIGDKSSKEAIIVDPGAEADKILSVIDKEQLRVKYVIATHGHFDHCGAVSTIKKRLNCEFLIHSADLPFIQRAHKSAARWKINIDKVPYPDRFIDEQDTISIGTHTIAILHTPGHSPGSISLYLKSKGFLLSGDTLFKQSIGRTDFTDGSLEDITSSIRNKLYILPDETIVYCGHGESTTIGFEKQNNSFIAARELQ